MLSFNFRAKTQHGKTIADRITAKTLKEAWSLLEQQGYKDIKLLDNEISAIKLENDVSTLRLAVTAQQEQTSRRQKSIVMQIIGRFFFQQNVIIWLSLLFLLAYGWGINSRDIIILAIDLLAVYVLWFVWANIPSYLYHQALEAYTWAKWHDVEKWMHALQRCRTWFKTPFPEHEMLFRLATADAGQGRLNDGLRRVAHLEHDTTLTLGFYHGRLASLFSVSKNYSQTAECQRKAFDLNPSDSTAIDLAFTLVRYLNDFPAAQTLIDNIDKERTPQIVKIYIRYCQAIIAVENRQAQKACQYLDDFFAWSIDYSGNPLSQGLRLEAHAYYALALARMGDYELAKKHFATALPMLVTWHDDELITRCKKALERA